MKSTNRGLLISILIAVVVAAGSIGCAGSASTSPPPSPPVISVNLSPSGAQSVAQGRTVNFTASIVNDSRLPVCGY